MSTRICKNGAMIIDGDTHISQWVENEGLIHDKYTAKLIHNIIKSRNIRHCIDLGANIGTLTRVMLNAGAKVLAFEPNMEAYECLIHNCPEMKMKWDAPFNNQAFFYIVGSWTKRYKYVTDQNAGAGHCVPDEKGTNCVSLDMLRDELNIKCGFLKMDIEGMEYEALKGAEGLIRDFRPHMLIEINQGALECHGATPEDIFSFLRRHHYRFYNSMPQYGLEGSQYDIICEPL